MTPLRKTAIAAAVVAIAVLAYELASYRPTPPDAVWVVVPTATKTNAADVPTPYWTLSAEPVVAASPGATPLDLLASAIVSPDGVVHEITLHPQISFVTRVRAAMTDGSYVWPHAIGGYGETSETYDVAGATWRRFTRNR